MIKCPLTGSSHNTTIYEQKSVPLIQNKVYLSKEEAVNAKCVDVMLSQSLDNGFVFNANFDDSIISYDENYQNEQSNSFYFQEHLRNVMSILQNNDVLSRKVVEIGCGKAYFMDMLLKNGVDVTGFDPTYEGDSTKIIKDFFSEKYSDVGAELIILRHTLEHISRPFHFIKTIAQSNNYKGKIYIEVPTFEWIVKHNATEDIFYEHCNYFTPDTLKMFFKKSISETFFKGQYFYVLADLGDVKETIEDREIDFYKPKFDERKAEYKSLLSELKNIAIWGAGGKGSTFLNLLDKNCDSVKCVIDINPKKQHKYLGGSGHYIIPPDELSQWGIENIILMNINYLEEIKIITDPLNIKLVTI